MIRTSSFQERLEEAIEPQPRGFVGIADRLLALACEHALSVGEGSEGLWVRTSQCEVSRHFGRPILRAILSQVSFLCEEPRCSPYGSQGEILMPDSTCTLHVDFMNTSTEYWLKLSRKD